MPALPSITLTTCDGLPGQLSDADDQPQFLTFLEKIKAAREKTERDIVITHLQLSSSGSMTAVDTYNLVNAKDTYVHVQTTDPDDARKIVFLSGCRTPSHERSKHHETLAVHYSAFISP